MSDLKKFPRTQHLKGSRKQSDDHDLESVSWSSITGKHLVVEEKMNGSNCGISFDENGTLLLQSRGHYLRGGPRELQFAWLKQWASCHQDAFRRVLGTRYVMYGENMFAKHTVFYDALPHYFMEFDVLDTNNDTFLSTEARKNLLVGLPVRSVKVLHEGAVASLGSLAGMITESNFITKDRPEHLRLASMASGVMFADALTHTDMHLQMEGLYVKWEENGEVKGRYKFVRGSFTNSILEQDSHWHDRPIIQNKLLPGSYEEMFK